MYIIAKVILICQLNLLVIVNVDLAMEYNIQTWL